MRRFLDVISLAARFYLAWLFIYASYDKIWIPASFAWDMAQYDLLPIWAVNSASVLLAWLEMLIGLCMLTGLLLRPAAVWASLLLAMFAGLMFYAGYTGALYDCGCFPGQQGDHPAGYQAAFRDLAMLIPALWVIMRPGNWLTRKPPRKNSYY